MLQTMVYIKSEMAYKSNGIVDTGFYSCFFINCSYMIFPSLNLVGQKNISHCNANCNEIFKYLETEVKILEGN